MGADHKPLLGLLGDTHSTSSQASAGILWCSVNLSMFRFWKTDAHAWQWWWS